MGPLRRRGGIFKRWERPQRMISEEQFDYGET
jgi:hypothetical protein